MTYMNILQEMLGSLISFENDIMKQGGAILDKYKYLIQVFQVIGDAIRPCR